MSERHNDDGDRSRRDRDRDRGKDRGRYGPRSSATAATAASTASSFGIDAAMFVMIGETAPPPPINQFIFFRDPVGEIRSVGQHGDVTTTFAAALNVANGVPPFAGGVARVLTYTGSQATCMRRFESSGAA